MKTRMLFLLVAAVMLSLSLTFAQDKHDCSQPCDMKTAAAKSCCKDGGTVASKTTDATQANVMFASDKKTTAKASEECTGAKDCTVKGVKMTAAECAAHCAAMKTKMTKASNTTSGCCKDKAKTVRAEKKSTDKA